jgi:glycolate oxidase
MANGDVIVSRLVESLPEDVLVVDPVWMENYRYDWTGYLSAGRPIAVVRGDGVAGVQTAWRWASAHGVPAVPRGAGTSLAGGATAGEGCVVCAPSG